MIELREIDTARAMLKQTQVFTRMKVEDPERCNRLESLCSRTYFDAKCALSGQRCACRGSSQPTVRFTGKVQQERQRCPSLADAVLLTVQGGVWQPAQGQTAGAAGADTVRRGQHGASITADGAHRPGAEMVQAV